jgi:hypothetical protein
MGLGVKFSDGPDGGLTAIGVEKGGSVADAGGEIGDVWLTIDGERATEVLGQRHDGTRAHRPGVPLTVLVERASERLVIRPMWRSDDPKRRPSQPPSLRAACRRALSTSTSGSASLIARKSAGAP